LILRIENQKIPLEKIDCSLFLYLYASNIFAENRILIIKLNYLLLNAEFKRKLKEDYGS
jgi:hypothetical protein